jgi:HEAT repeat protein
MRTQYKRSWTLLTSFAGWAGVASTVAFVVEPDGLRQLTQAADVQCIEQPGESAQTTHLVKLLQGSSQFRVRAQAAISLGLMERSLAARDALTVALRDVQPGVRAAAAMSLGRIGDANHIVALRKLGGDPEEPVRNAARASIGRLESTLNRPAVDPETAATTAALSATIRASRL